MRTEAYIQVVGWFNQTAINLDPTDTGGELDPHGADLAGNPLGGLMYSTGLPSGDNSTYQQTGRLLGSAMYMYMYIAESQNRGTTLSARTSSASSCATPTTRPTSTTARSELHRVGLPVNDRLTLRSIYDLIGCNYNMPAAYEPGVFLACEGDLQDEVGTYTSGGQSEQ